MKKYRTLVRLRKQDVDDCRVLLAALETRRATILTAIANLEMQKIREQKITAGQVLFQSVYGEYAARSILERDRLITEQSNINTEIEAARTALTEAFAEMKKFEFALEINRRKQRRKESLREGKLMDEIGTLNRRRHEGL